MAEMENLQQNKNVFEKIPAVPRLILQVFLLSVFAFFIGFWFSFSKLGIYLIVLVILWPLTLGIYPSIFIIFLFLVSIILFVRWLFFSIASVKYWLAQKKNLSLKSMLAIVSILFLSILFFVATFYCALGIASPVF